jgi:hypothetical protein
METVSWERRLNIAGSIASITALVYLIYELSGTREQRSTSMAGLPTRGRIPLATARRALARLPKSRQSCPGMDARTLREGMEIEREHRDITGGAIGTTAKIAAAHICEAGPRYYTELKRLERRLAHR